MGLTPYGPHIHGGKGGFLCLKAAVSARIKGFAVLRKLGSRELYRFKKYL